jgi:hypothetical protein
MIMLQSFGSHSHFLQKYVASNQPHMIRKCKFLSVLPLNLGMTSIKNGMFSSNFIIKRLRITTTSPALLTSWSPSLTSHSTTVQHGSVGSGRSTQRSAEVLFTGGHLHRSLTYKNLCNMLLITCNKDSQLLSSTVMHLGLLSNVISYNSRSWTTPT